MVCKSSNSLFCQYTKFSHLAGFRIMRLVSFLLATQLPFTIVGFQSVATRLCAARHASHPEVKKTSKRTTRLFDYDERDLWESDLKDTTSTLQRITAIETLIQSQDTNLRDYSSEIEEIEQSISQWAPLCPPGLSSQDFAKTISAYSTLPLSLKWGLYLALEMDTTESPYPTLGQYPEICSRLYEERFQLTAQRLEDGMAEATKRMSVSSSSSSSSSGFSTKEMDVDELVDEIILELFDGKSAEQLSRDNGVKQQLGRVTRKPGKGVSKEDLNTLTQALKEIFVMTGAPEEIPGGYVIRGSNRKKTPEELINALDTAIPIASWESQVSFLPDFTDPPLEGEPVLLLLNKDFESQSKWVLPLSTGLAASTTFFYAISVFAKNEAVAGQLADRNALGDLSGFDWFSGHLLEFFAPLFVIHVLHELGHILVAKRDKIETSLPALIPFYNSLPNLGFRTNIKTSPPNLTSLFDFAFVGPLMGTIASLTLLAYGVQATLLADSASLQYFPALTVAEIRMSTLGSGIVDYLFGGEGVITSQDPETSIALHPYVIAGFSGLIIQAIELLPLGSTDGGRMSQAIFGRGNHIIVGSLTWFALVVAGLVLDEQSSYIIWQAWIINNFAQNDMEIPCREEMSKVDMFRSVAGFGLWFVAILALVPMSQ